MTTLPADEADTDGRGPRDGADRSDDADGTVGPGSVLRFHPLGERRDGDEWVVGRVDTGDVVAIPDVGMRALRLLRAGRTPGEASDRLASDGGPRFDVVDFAEVLVAEGFVSEVDGVALRGRPVPRSSLPWLRPDHVRWVQHPATALISGALVVVALGILVVRPELLPTPGDYVWADRGSVVLLVNALVSWVMLGLHELAHLASARAVAVPGRVTLGTRLQFLVAQTDVTGIWLADRRARVTTYLAGLALDLSLAALAIVARLATRPPDAIDGVLAVVVLLAVTGVVYQASVFVRTDLYFLIQDLTGCRNLHGDALAYARWWAARAGRRLPVRHHRPHADADRGRGDDGGGGDDDPTRQLPPGERRVVRAYTPMMLVGSGLALGFFVVVSIPATAKLYRVALGNLAAGGTVANLDAAVTIALTSLVQLLWLYAFVTRRRERRRQPPAGEVRPG